MRNLIFYSSYYEAIKELPDEEQGKVYKAVIDYAMERIEPNLTGVSKAMFVLIQPSLDASRKNYENGTKGGRPAKNKTQVETEEITQIETQSITQHKTQTESYQIFEKEKDNREIIKENKEEKEEKEKEITHTSRFVPPTLEEVKAYAVERGSNVDPQKFFEYFETGNWTDSKGNKVKNWKQKFITWEGERRNTPKETSDTQLSRAIRRLTQ